MPSLTTLTQLQSEIDCSQILSTANLGSHLIARSLLANDCDVKATVDSLTEFAQWHQSKLGSSSARVSIKHVHSLLRTRQLVLLPNSFDRHGNRLILFTPDSSTSQQSLETVLMYFAYWFHQQPLETGCLVLVNLQHVACDPLHWLPNLHAFFTSTNPARPSPLRFLCIHQTLAISSVWSQARGILNENALDFESVPVDRASLYVDSRYLPKEFGGTREDWHVAVEVDEFIRARYEAEWGGIPKVEPQIQFSDVEMVETSGDAMEVDVVANHGKSTKRAFNDGDESARPTIFKRVKANVSNLLSMVTEHNLGGTIPGL
ncbi:hypothetical protein BCR33DRAFT_826799 [Rhizoclosmatium globosum]|uniref:CRAL-TRIO domain-containing protein n=1 Tax=Rhizoclosmatium globosum TaxID=329046 RepID=A0A1Y2C1M7_9FUNG|nr:hypothetical protein BCR33DRAFT_826799 [Rhizoclosmatium globosum]|eukprot:ORY40938.1 hypothetical protein BCR33DRAFT_826799 [Rhizoclosmatium globosum]